MTYYNAPQEIEISTKGDKLQTPKDVEYMLNLHSLGWGSRRIAKELRVSRKTVRHYLKAGGWVPYGKPKRPSVLDGHEAWLEERFLQHKGNADVVRQELEKLGIGVSLRTVERAVAHLRKELHLKAKATVRFETPPGKQLQIDFGSTHVLVGGERVKIFLFVATLGFSRRIFVAPFLHERQVAWFRGIEGAFQHFGGIPEDALLDNARALVLHHNPVTREVQFSPRFHQFAQYWGFRPIACAPYRARTKGKDERAVGYVKKNAIAGREFPSWEVFEQHLHYWMMEIADKRTHGTTGEKPEDRFLQELPALKPLEGRAPYIQIQEHQRVVHTDACIELEANWYSVPWHLIGAQVRAQIIESKVQIFHGKNLVATHPENAGHRQRSIQRDHLRGIVSESRALQEGSLQRPLSDYEAVIGGGF